MFDMPDLRAGPKKPTGCPNSLMGIIYANPDFSRFKYMVETARMQTVLDNMQANCTLFIPSDKAIAHISDSLFVNMDSAVARHIVKSSMLQNVISSDLLEDSSAAYFRTADPSNRLYITNISGKTQINNSINVIRKDIRASNGMIHITDQMIWPECI
jgi:uncharacterized surface protein with fasciclin (FAS1) repeats